MMETDSELHNHKFIVFSQDHYNPLNVIRSLGEKGLKPISIVYGSNKWMIPYCKYVDKLYSVKTIDEGYRILMDEYGHEKTKSFIFCSDDLTTSYLDNHFEELKDSFFFYNAGQAGRIVWLQNKDNITNLGLNVELSCPSKEIVDKGELPHTLRYPIMTKALSSTMGAWKGDVYICHNEQELKDAYTRILSPKLILQEFIKKKGEFCIEGFAINDGKDVFIPYRIDYIRFFYDNYGHYMTVMPFEDGDLKSRILELIKLTKFNGIFELEFMIGQNDEIYFLEINFRSSTWTYAVTVGGGNLPYYWAKSTILGRIPYEEIKIRDTKFTAIQEPDDFALNVLKSKRVKFSQWKREVKECECRFFYNKHDKSPFYHYLFFRLLNKIFKKNYLIQ